jgi:hypothetical protein
VSLIHYFAGKKAASISINPKNYSSDVKLSIRYYNDLLNFLIVRGALLSNVKAEFLLTAEEFKTCNSSHEYQNRSSSPNSNEISELQEIINNYSLISREAWCSLILQVLRIFLFPATGCFLSKSLTDEDQVDIQLLLQNNYSSYPNSTDATLLAWTSLIFKRVG